MTDRNDSLAITDPQRFMAEKRKSLDQALEEITVTDEAFSEIALTNAARAARDGLIEVIPFGKIITAALQWNDTVDQDIREAKKEFLLSSLRDKCSSTEEALRRLRELIVSPQGNTLFNKIIRILDDSPPDIELLEHLSSALKHISDTDFEQLFEQHRFALAQIERLSPQALSLLARHREWPAFAVGMVSSTGGVVTSAYIEEFATAFTNRIGAPHLADRVSHCGAELQSGQFIAARALEDRRVQPHPTRIGQFLLPYLGG